MLVFISKTSDICEKIKFKRLRNPMKIINIFKGNKGLYFFIFIHIPQIDFIQFSAFFPNFPTGVSPFGYFGDVVEENGVPLIIVNGKIIT